MTKIICNTKFKLDAFADGGSKRSVQIREWLTDNQLMWEDDSFILPKGLKWSRLCMLAWRAMAIIRKYYPQKILSVSQYIRLIKYYALRVPIVYDKYKNEDVVFLWENTNDRDILYLMKATGHPVIAFPHNLESLVCSRSCLKLNDEIENLKYSDVVFTIAKEETWLLRLWGINAHYFPYYPPRTVDDYFSNIRRLREKRSENRSLKYLLLGSATNPPTKNGMQALIDYMNSQSLSFDIIVAGYGTELLRRVDNQCISYMGSISNEALQELLITVDALLIYQPPTTGSLTRIPEMLLAGVPIFANFDASRNNHNIEGMTIYSSFEQLYELLCNGQKILPPIPDAEKAYLHQDVLMLKRFIKDDPNF